MFCFFIENSSGFFKTPWQLTDKFIEASYIGNSTFREFQELREMHEFYNVTSMKKNLIKEQFPEKFL